MISFRPLSLYSPEEHERMANFHSICYKSLRDVYQNKQQRYVEKVVRNSTPMQNGTERFLGIQNRWHEVERHEVPQEQIW